MYTLNYVNWRWIPSRIPPEFRLIPADSPRNTQNPWIPPGFRGESVGEWKVLEAEDRHKEIPPNTICIEDIVEAQLLFEGI